MIKTFFHEQQFVTIFLKQKLQKIISDCSKSNFLEKFLNLAVANIHFIYIRHMHKKLLLSKESI